MQRPQRLLFLLSTFVVAGATDWCSGGEGGIDVPMSADCKTSCTIVVEQGTASALPNLCTQTENTNEWDVGLWDWDWRSLPTPLELDQTTTDEVAVLLVKAPMDAELGERESTLNVTRRNCSGDACSVAIAVTVVVVEPGHEFPLTARITATRANGEPVDALGWLPPGEVVTLTAVVEGSGADDATTQWHGMDLVGAAIDSAVDGSTARVVRTSPFQRRERAYELIAENGTTTARAVILLRGGARDLFVGPKVPVPNYAGTAWTLTYDTSVPFLNVEDDAKSGTAIVEKLTQSESMDPPAQNAFLTDPMLQAQADWSGRTEPEDRLNCGIMDTEQSQCDYEPSIEPKYFAPTAYAHDVGIFRVVFEGKIGTHDDDNFIFSHVFVRQ